MKKNVLIRAAIVLGASVLYASQLVTRYFMRVALDRKCPRGIDRAMANVSGIKVKSDVINIVEKATETLRNSETKKIEIISFDGERLVGYLKLSENPKRVIIAMHGWRSNWAKDFGLIAPFWEENNCTVLFAQQRGQGESGGNYIGFGLIERYDCIPWVKWVSENINQEIPVYLAGLSMGATTVLMAAGLDLPENVHGIMADCGFISPYEIFRHIAKKNLHLTYGIMGAIANDICKRKIQTGTKGYSTIEAMKRCKVPVLFAHGTDDSFVPVGMTYENYKACNGPKKLLIVPGAEHAMSYLVEREVYQKTIKEFWKEND